VPLSRNPAKSTLAGFFHKCPTNGPHSLWVRLWVTSIFNGCGVRTKKRNGSDRLQLILTILRSNASY
jgi:hypothetical protein